MSMAVGVSSWKSIRSGLSSGKNKLDLLSGTVDADWSRAVDVAVGDGSGLIGDSRWSNGSSWSSVSGMTVPDVC